MTENWNIPLNILNKLYLEQTFTFLTVGLHRSCRGTAQRESNMVIYLPVGVQLESNMVIYL